jgi:hypothetical protein
MTKLLSPNLTITMRNFLINAFGEDCLSLWCWHVAVRHAWGAVGWSTSVSSPSLSLIFQWRLTSCTGSAPALTMCTKYSNV